VLGEAFSWDLLVKEGKEYNALLSISFLRHEDYCSAILRLMTVNMRFSSLHAWLTFTVSVEGALICIPDGIRRNGW